jgi:hypothetical protein
MCIYIRVYIYVYIYIHIYREFEPNSIEEDAAVIFMPEGSKDQMVCTYVRI